MIALSREWSGCFRPFTLPYFCHQSAEDPYCQNSIAFHIVVPYKILRAVDFALQNNSETLWFDAHAQTGMLVQMFPYEALLQACPPLLIASYVFNALLGIIGRSDMSPRASMARAELLASHLGLGTRQSRESISAWTEFLGSKWPALQEAPGRALSNLGCEAAYSKVTLSGMMNGDLRDRPDAACFRGDALLSSAQFAKAMAEHSELPAPIATLHSSKLAFELRPVPIGIGFGHSEFLDLVLQRHLMQALQDVPEGLLLEFGVAWGGTTNVIVRNAGKAVRQLDLGKVRLHYFGFDSFEGLNRNWRGHPAGEYATSDGMPPDVSNLSDEPVDIDFVKGYFEESVPAFFERLQEAFDGTPPAVALVHLDADLYASTRLVLKELSPFLRKGSVLVFDDVLCGTASRNANALQQGEDPKEVWEALHETMLAGDSVWPWRLEVLAAPWNMHLFAEGISGPC